MTSIGDDQFMNGKPLGSRNLHQDAQSVERNSVERLSHEVVEVVQGLRAYRQGLRGATSQMGRGTDFRMAWPLPPIGKGLGKIHRKCRSLGPDRPYPAHDAASCKSLKSHIPF